jgi:hypothetical protein
MDCEEKHSLQKYHLPFYFQVDGGGKMKNALQEVYCYLCKKT